MDSTHLFELVIAVLFAVVALHYLARRLRLPPTVALLAGGASMAFLPGLPTVTLNPELVLVLFLPPLLLDGAWSIPMGQLSRHKIGIASLAIGAVIFTAAAIAFVTRLLFPSLPWAACAALGAIVSPPDAVSARAILQQVKLPRRLRILLEGESLLNDASGLVLFRFAVAAGLTGAFNLADAVGSFFVLALGGALVGAGAGLLWLRLVCRLGDEYLVIVTTVLMSWGTYLLGEKLHVSGVIATVTIGLIMSWHQHTAFSASTRMRGTSFWTVTIFLMEAAVFMLIGFSLRGVIDRVGGVGLAMERMGRPILAILAALLAARFIWVFASDRVIALLKASGRTRHSPLGAGSATVLSWAGVRGVVTLALALSLPAGFPGRDFIVVTAFAVILGTVLIQGTTLGRVIRWAGLDAAESEKAPLTMSQAEAALAQAQLKHVETRAYDGDGKLIHAQLLEHYQVRNERVADYAENTDDYTPILLAHFGVVLEAIAAARSELIRLHRSGQVDDETLHELERDLDLEELSTIAARPAMG